MTPLLAASMLDPLYQALGSVLAFFYSVVPSYGVAIILLTLAVRAVLIPLTAKQVKSQQAMQRLQPEMKRLQAKHKGDRQKLNEEMMKFYKEHNFNPLSGCLPVLLQAPLFIVLYRLIHDLTPAGGKPPKHVPQSSDLYTSLVESGGRMVSWGIDLGHKASGVQGLGKAFPFYVLVGLVIATGFYQQRQLSARLPQGTANAQMQMIGKIFPVFIGLISLSIPAGVVVYFITSNLWQIAQQAVTFRNAPPPPTPDADPPAKSKAPAPKLDKRPAGGGSRSKTGSGGSRSKGSPGRAKNTSKGRPPPSPRPKGLPASRNKGGQPSKGTSRKDK